MDEYQHYFNQNDKFPTVIKLSAPWCGPCKAIAPFFHELANLYEDKTIFLDIDIDELEEINEKFDFKSIPTFYIFYQGEKQFETSGGSKMVIEEIHNKLQTFWV